MKNFRIIFTETELFMGNMVERQHSTKWMTKEEALNSHYLNKASAKVVRRG